MESSLFDVFLCHNTADRSAVRAIAQQLRSMGLKPWLDVDEILGGQSWLGVLEQQIATVRAVAVFVGEQGMGNWQREESQLYFRRSVEEGVRFIPVLLEGATEEPGLSSFFLNRQWVDFRQPGALEKM
jgi:hypothetical protein